MCCRKDSIPDDGEFVEVELPESGALCCRIQAGDVTHSFVLALFQLLIIVAIGVGLLINTEGLNDGVLTFSISGF